MSRPVHMAGKINPKGDVSALCFNPPRSIDLRRATWTMKHQMVTCQKCLRAIIDREAKPGEESAAIPASDSTVPPGDGAAACKG